MCNVFGFLLRTDPGKNILPSSSQGAVQMTRKGPQGSRKYRARIPQASGRIQQGFFESRKFLQAILASPKNLARGLGFGENPCEGFRLRRKILQGIWASTKKIASIFW